LRRATAIAAAGLALGSGMVVAAVKQAHAAAACSVVYTITNQWDTGFGANMNVTNLGDPITSWTLTFDFGAGQQITQLWHGYVNPDWAANVQAGATATGGTLGQQEARVARYSTAVWLDRIAAVTGGSGVTRTLAGHLDAAVAQAAGSSAPVVVTIVVYDLPNR